MSQREEEGVCRVCGCTDQHGCMVWLSGVGTPCCWVEPDLCSKCATIEQLWQSEAGLHWLSELLPGALQAEAEAGGIEGLFAEMLQGEIAEEVAVPVVWTPDGY